jgi:hypothetical protein
MSVSTTFLRLCRDTTARVIAALLVIMSILEWFRDTPSAARWPLRLVFIASCGWLVIAAWRTIRSIRFTAKKLVFSAVLALLLYGALSVLCAVFVAVMSSRDDHIVRRGELTLSEGARIGLTSVISGESMATYHPVIGWVPTARLHNDSYSTNSQGMRGTREYERKSAAPARRMLCLGDSFTFGVAVDDDETYPAQAEKQCPGTEWLNFAIPGACLTQAFLRYQEQASAYDAGTVVIGFMTNDAQRTVNCFRPFLNVDSGFPLPKAYSRLVGNQLVVEPNPCPNIAGLQALLDNERKELQRLLALDYLTWSGSWRPHGPIAQTLTYIFNTQSIDLNLDALDNQRFRLGSWIKSQLPIDPYGDDIWNPESRGFKTICALADHFIKQVIADGRTPLFVIMPGPQDVDDYVKHNPPIYAALVNHLKSTNANYLDFLPPLVAKHQGHLKSEDLFVKFHYQPQINQELATEIIQALHLH